MENKTSAQLLQLIHDYQNKVVEGVTLLEQASKGVCPLHAWRIGKLPQKGKIKKIEYFLHGIGCAFSFPDCEVDFDYAPLIIDSELQENSRYDGFDLWRLSIYLESCLQRYPDYSTEQLKTDFEQAKNKIFHRIPNSNLYFLD